MNLECYEALKRKVDRLQRDHDRAEGALDELLAQLKADHNCDSVAQADKLLKRLGKEEKRLCSEFEQVVEEFETEWAEQLDE